MTSFCNYFGRQRNITCDDKIAHAKPFHYLIVGDIKTRCHLEHSDAVRRRYAQRLISYERELHPGTLCRSKQNILNRHRACICVCPHFHFWPRLLSATAKLGCRQKHGHDRGDALSGQLEDSTIFPYLGLSPIQETRNDCAPTKKRDPLPISRGNR